MLPGHLFLLKQAVKEMNRASTTARVRTIQIQLNGTHGGIRTGGPVAGAATASATAPVVVATVTAAAAAVPHVTETLPTKRKAQGHGLPQFCRSTHEVRVESL